MLYTSCLGDGVCAELVSGKGTERAGKRALEPHTLLTPAAPGAVTALMQIICLGEFFYSSAQKTKTDTLNGKVKHVQAGAVVPHNNINAVEVKKMNKLD